MNFLYIYIYMTSFQLTTECFIKAITELLVLNKRDRDRTKKGAKNLDFLILNDLTNSENCDLKESLCITQNSV